MKNFSDDYCFIGRDGNSDYPPLNYRPNQETEMPYGDKEFEYQKPIEFIITSTSRKPKLGNYYSVDGVCHVISQYAKDTLESIALKDTMEQDNLKELLDSICLSDIGIFLDEDKTLQSINLKGVELQEAKLQNVLQLLRLRSDDNYTKLMKRLDSVKLNDLKGFHKLNEQYNDITQYQFISLKELYMPIKLEGVQFINAILFDKKGEPYDGYYYIHIYNRIECVDRENSVFTTFRSGNINLLEKLVLEDKQLAVIPKDKRLIIALKESPTRTLFEESVVNKLLEATYDTGMTAYRVSKWSLAAPFENEWIKCTLR